MHPFRHTIIAAALAGLSAGVLAYLLESFIGNPSVRLALCLAVFGLVERLILDARRSQQRRIVLRESLKSFCDNLHGRTMVKPLWADLQRQLSELHDIETGSKHRTLLREALSEVSRLGNQKSFHAMTEGDVSALLRLKQSME